MVFGLFSKEKALQRTIDRATNKLAQQPDRWGAMEKLGEWSAVSDDDLIKRVVPYLADFDENVRFATIDALASRDAKRIGESLIDGLLRPEEESGRIKLRIAQVLAEKKIPLGDRASQVASGVTGTIRAFAV